MTTTNPARARVYRDASDWWIGLYIGPNHLYWCPLPTLVIRVRRTSQTDPPRRAA
jgi:hypothetical protein